MLYGCSSLISLPDISKWKLNKVQFKESIFNECSSLISIPNLKFKDISIYNNCFSLLKIPKESEINNVESILPYEYKGGSEILSGQEIESMNRKLGNDYNNHYQLNEEEEEFDYPNEYPYQYL